VESVGLPNRASYRSCHRRRRDRIPLLTAARLLGDLTRTPSIGNPLAIFTDARCLTDKEMQALAREIRMSPTSTLSSLSATQRRYSYFFLR